MDFPKTKLGAAALGVGGAVAGAAAVITPAGFALHHRLKKQREWHEKAGRNDILGIGSDLYIDKHGAMFPGKHPHLKGKKITELLAKLDELLLNDPRPRNNLGEFSPQQEGVADPNSMAATYATPKKAAGYAGAAVAGGALGSVGGAAGKDGYNALKNLLSKVRKPKA